MGHGLTLVSRDHRGFRESAGDRYSIPGGGNANQYLKSPAAGTVKFPAPLRDRRAGVDALLGRDRGGVHKVYDLTNTSK